MSTVARPVSSKALSSEGSERPSAELYRLSDLPSKELAREFLRGQRPDPEDIAGWEFRGLNHHRATRFLGIRKFIKGFYRSSGGLYGYNIKVAQTPLTEEWAALPDEDNPVRHGFYRVRRPDPTERDNAHLHALLLDYGQGENPRFDPTRGLRDYLVQLTDDVFLGAAYYALGNRRVLLPSYFILDRFRRGVTEAP